MWYHNIYVIFFLGQVLLVQSTWLLMQRMTRFMVWFHAWPYRTSYIQYHLTCFLFMGGRMFAPFETMTVVIALCTRHRAIFQLCEALVPGSVARAIPVSTKMQRKMHQLCKKRKMERKCFDVIPWNFSVCMWCKQGSMKHLMMPASNHIVFIWKFEIRRNLCMFGIFLILPQRFCLRLFDVDSSGQNVLIAPHLGRRLCKCVHISWLPGHPGPVKARLGRAGECGEHWSR